MKRLALLVLLPLLGCRAVYIDHRPDGTTRVYAASILTDPAITGASWESPQTKVKLEGYQSKSAVTGADIATFAAALAKMFLAVP